MSLATVAVTVLVASRVPVSLSARTSKVCEPLLTEVEAQTPKVSPNGALISVSTSLPSTRNWIEPGSSSTLSPFLSYTARQFTTPVNVAPFAIVCVTAPVERLRRRRCAGVQGEVAVGERSRVARERMPPASFASTPSVYVVPHLSPVNSPVVPVVSLVRDPDR